ncbi:acyl-CoA dehydrogenase family protein [Saccharothrix obliqua]|uniref:acyl-CoA dehydrogenase family protein n=1 Tax=Saccharothrix obliqua TaxID=2861747 RepID=UPI001C60242F|nr:acyl-CoA dehydrogenase family protein [Saccharothrix obliqua]MBW4718167.1 acyl-CoA dehydrogenase family protein [Saccharothrix obliqua]
MDFGLTAEQSAYAATVAEFAARELNDAIAERDRDSAFSAEAWRKCARLGLTGLPLPVEHGGGGADAVTTAAALEALGHGCRDNGLIFSLGAHLWAGAVPIARFGTDAQRRRYLPAACDGSLVIAHAATEPDAGSDPAQLTTTATPVEGGFRLDGGKTFVTNAPVAGLFLVLATTNRVRRHAGLCAFLVERDTRGLTVGPPTDKMGLRTSPMADLHLDGCHVPTDAVLGPPGAGMAIFNATMRRERGFILAPAVGTMRRHLDQCVAYARGRRQHGRAIGDFQAVAHRIVDMRLRLDTARTLLYRFAWLLDEKRDTDSDAALLKLHLSECLVQSASDAVHLHGGSGYTTALGLERELRDALGGRVYSGTTEIQKNIAARLLGLGVGT